MASTVRIERFCGQVVFAVERVEVYVSRPDEDEAGGVLLNLEIHCAKSTEEDSPEAERIGWTKPSVEIWVPVPDATPAAVDGLHVEIPWSCLEGRDAWQHVHVFESGDLSNLDVRFRVVHGETCHVSLVAKARDPNHYDGSKPDATVRAEADFELE